MSRTPTDEPPLQHVAMIMDGNGRWAKAKHVPRAEGHRAGAETIRRMVEACHDVGIHYLTLYAFSTENWERPKSEVRALMRLLEHYLRRRSGDLLKHRVRLQAIGDLRRLPPTTRAALDYVVQETRDCSNGVLTLALNYGARAEIVRATKAIAESIRDGSLGPEDISEELFASRLYTADMPDPDLIIRTAGEMRLSNFLLWQASYAEFWSTASYWPDFSTEEFLTALEDYRHRTRRFGGLPDAENQAGD